jgi:hypothetical protein
VKDSRGLLLNSLQTLAFGTHEASSRSELGDFEQAVCCGTEQTRKEVVLGMKTLKHRGNSLTHLEDIATTNSRLLILSKSICFPAFTLMTSAPIPQHHALT